MTDIQTNISEGSRSSSIHPLIHPFTPMREGYCTPMELTSEHRKLWATDPQLQRPAIVAALAHCSVKTWAISSNGTSFRLHRLCCSTHSNFKPWPSHWQGMIWGGANPQNFCMPCRMSSLQNLNCDHLGLSAFSVHYPDPDCPARGSLGAHTLVAARSHQRGRGEDPGF